MLIILIFTLTAFIFFFIIIIIIIIIIISISIIIIIIIIIISIIIIIIVTTSTIWLEFRVPEGKNILISSIYRQWTLPKALGINNSNNIHNQTTRWHTVITQWQKAHKENKEII